VYGVLGGKSDAGTTESNVDVIFPVALDMTMVAAESPPDRMARDEAMTVIGEAPAASDKALGGDLGGVG